MSIQNVEAPILTAGNFPGLRFDNAISIAITAGEHEVWASFSDNLNDTSARFKVGKAGTVGALTFNFSQPTSGTIFFASADAANPARAMLMQFCQATY